MKNLVKIIALAIAFLPSAASAQYSDNMGGLFKSMNDHNVFNHLEVAANIGTTGLGLELASPMTKWAKLRVGVDFMPRFTIPMTFGLDSYVDGQINDKFGRIQEMMYEMSGMEIDKDIKMESKPTMTTMRLLVDVTPFRNRHWHITAGVFIGGKSVGKSVNKMDEMPSLLTLNMYNRFYEQFRNIPTQSEEAFQEYIIDNPINFPIIGEQWIDPNPASPDFQMFYDKIHSYQQFGELGIHVGDHKDGTPYMMHPDVDGTVTARAKVWRVRPYVGFGYGGFMDDDQRWHASFDAGIQFWGGAPKVTTHDGTVLNDLTNLRGKVDSYMGLMKTLVVYPTIDFRLAYCF